jgi:hypothetical protein
MAAIKTVIISLRVWSYVKLSSDIHLIQKQYI